ncbi:MAG: class I SAM-dependent methyltransferase [Methylovulum sp.]|jgi:SAM-dependent methyltransferase
MKRNFLFNWYQTPRGKLLKELETEYLKRAITVSCQQIVVQIGGLGWEDEFIDCTLYKFYTILDIKKLGSPLARKICARAYNLPLKSDSVDMIIVSHLLEFDTCRFQTMREIERILKPEGIVLIVNFNPWSLWVWYQFLWEKKLADSWRGHFISKARVFDWLKLLNFEVTMTTDFFLDEVKTKHGKAMSSAIPWSATAYGVKAIKRRYTLIPLTPVPSKAVKLMAINSITPSAHVEKNE